MSDFSHIDVYKTRKTLIERCKGRTPVVPTSGARLRATQIDRMNGFDPEAWRAFYTPYRNYAFKTIRYRYSGYGLSSSECEELAQEVMEKVTETIVKFDPDHPSKYNRGEKVKFRTWFYHQVRTVVRNYLRRLKKDLETIEFDPELDTDLAAFDAQFHEEREQAILAKALELLAQGRTSRRTIEAYQMFVNGRPVAEIAEELDMPENSVHQAVCRCRRSLEKHRRELEELL